MNKHAAVYIRVSSEQQAEGASPDEQERECKALAAEHGLEVVEVYRDVKAYRAGKKLVEPSGTRDNRPGLVAMLRDAAAGRFNVIIAWREDRLYRGLKPMQLVLDCIEQYRITIMLARETFDMKLAPLKAWVASMELDAIRERMTMGTKARLRAGKASAGQNRYGYRREGEKILIVEDEAAIVRAIFAWYIGGASLPEIRQRLLESGAPKPSGPRKARVPWSIGALRGIVSSEVEYSSGVLRYRRGGEIFEIRIDPIIDAETAAAVQARRNANKIYPARNVKHAYLFAGKIFCDCGRRWKGVSIHNARRDGFYQNYQCTQRHRELIASTCPRSIKLAKADEIGWQKFCEAFDKPDLIWAGVQLYIDDLRAKAESVLDDEARIQAKLDTLENERQTVIKWGREKIITEADVSYQLTEIDLQALHWRKELAACHQVMSLTAVEDWEQKAREFLADVRAGLDVIRSAPPDDPEMWNLKRSIVERMVQEVHIDQAHNLTVTIRFDVLALVGEMVEVKPIDIRLYRGYNRGHVQANFGGG